MDDTVELRHISSVDLGASVAFNVEDHLSDDMDRVASDDGYVYVAAFQINQVGASASAGTIVGGGNDKDDYHTGDPNHEEILELCVVDGTAGTVRTGQLTPPTAEGWADGHRLYDIWHFGKNSAQYNPRTKANGLRGISSRKSGDTPSHELARLGGRVGRKVPLPNPQTGQTEIHTLFVKNQADMLYLGLHGVRRNSAVYSENASHTPDWFLTPGDVLADGLWQDDVDIVIFSSCSVVAVAKHAKYEVVDDPSDPLYVHGRPFSPGEEWDKALNWGGDSDYDPSEFKVTLCGFYWATYSTMPVHIDKWFNAWRRGRDQNDTQISNRDFPELWCAHAIALYRGFYVPTACAIGKDGYYIATNQLTNLARVEGPLGFR
jgi:hypothetical protein